MDYVQISKWYVQPSNKKSMPYQTDSIFFYNKDKYFDSNKMCLKYDKKKKSNNKKILKGCVLKYLRVENTKKVCAKVPEGWNALPTQYLIYLYYWWSL